MKDYHKILGVHKDAKKDEIRRAYRRLALIYHPDRNKGADATDRFREINEAYRVLSGIDKPDAGPDWTESVINIWRDILDRKNDNMYR